MKLCCVGFVIAFVLQAAPELLGQNPELKMLAEEDQAARLGNSHVARTDEDRIKLVLELLARDAARTPEDKFNAALVLQHTGLDFCGKRLVSKSPYDYLLAHYLAKQSYEAGYDKARVLVAASIDRYLSFTEGHQRYGTNRVYNQKTGKEELVPIDRDVPDSERAKYGVPPLAQLLRAYPEQRTQDKAPAADADPWSDWKFLLGEWTLGEGAGVPGRASAGYFSLMPDMGGKVLLRKNHSEYAAANGKPAIIHDDLMIVFSEAGGTEALYNDSEGHVIHYNVSVSADKKQITFLSEQTTGEARYRLTYEDVNQDTVRVVFEIAPPDKPDQFSKYVEGIVRRKKVSR
ncbi:MAG TPA: hypothetical protein VKY85_05250 [Candidatus Angelobacter sp.]|nr:hypothetical protein [Candidatus Angelobacter sp.]